MKTVILAGGLGSRLSEETVAKPKPMVEIGGKPLLWHIMNIFAVHGLDEFVVALGYRGEVIKQYFLTFHALNNDLSIDLATGLTTAQGSGHLPWKVHLIDTGVPTQTGGRLKRLARFLKDDDTFMMTYGDGVADVDIRALLSFHASHRRLATVTAVRPPARFGSMRLEGHRVTAFSEKPQTREAWINGGFFALDRRVLDYIDDDDTIWERSPLERLAADGQLMAYRHEGFWQPVDTLRDQRLLEELWASGTAPWRRWA
jgi:glucose-1-phosphate cytidylyltransferase